jgi:hypothetical protein
MLRVHCVTLAASKLIVLESCLPKQQRFDIDTPEQIMP